MQQTLQLVAENSNSTGKYCQLTSDKQTMHSRFRDGGGRSLTEKFR